MALLRRSPGETPQILDQKRIPGQDENMACVMLPGAPAGELQDQDMIDNANAVHENHEKVNLKNIPPLQVDLRDDEEMLPAHNDHPQEQQNEPARQQVMSPREREGQLQANSAR